MKNIIKKEKKTKNTTKLKMVTILVIVIMLLVMSYNTIFATITDEIVITLSNETIRVNGEEISTDSSQNVYKSTKIEQNDDITQQVENTIINITTEGTYRITGTLNNGQIAVNAKDTDKVNLILDNIDISCTTAPAIIIYNASDSKIQEEAGVTITLEEDSKNNVIGSHIPKNAKYLENGEEASYNEKYDGAISSDISMLINGTGSLTIDGDKEGIETKMHLTINGGNLDISAGDDAINACEDNISVIVINNGTIYANIKSNSQEGDGIDSNGYIYINGGEIYTFASATSQDSGLDSDLGIYINGGTVIGTGNMVDEVSSESTQKYIFLQFNSRIEKQDLITITNQDNQAIMAYLTDKEYTIFLYSSPELDIESYNVYKGGSIEGESVHGLYQTIEKYTLGEEIEYTEADKSAGVMRGNFGGNKTKFEQENFQSQYNKTNNIYIGIGLLVIGLILIILVIINIKKTKSIK